MDARFIGSSRPVADGEFSFFLVPLYALAVATAAITRVLTLINDNAGRRAFSARGRRKKIRREFEFCERNDRAR